MVQECEEKILRTQADFDFGVRGRQEPSTEMIRDPVYLKTELGSDVGSGWSFCHDGPFMKAGCHEAMEVFPRWEL